MKAYIIYGQNDGEPQVEIAVITGERADEIVEMLFDYGEFSLHDIWYDTIWAAEDYE